MEKYRVYAGIDLDAVRYNMESMHNNIDKDTKIVAVVKADGYGHGALKIAEAIEDLPYLWGYAVATAEEAEELREHGCKKPMLILGISFPHQYPKIIEEEIRAAVCEYDVAKDLSDLAVQMNKTCYIHIAVDTGMSRIGFQVSEENANIIAQIAALPNICIEGIFTHFAQADELDKEPTHEQIARFKKMIALTEAAGVTIPLHHCSNSAGIVELPEANMNMVRAGITLYGLWPSEEVRKDIISLKPVMSLKSQIVYVKELEAGRKISYGGIYETVSKRRIATVPVGYADGYARGLSNKGYVLIRGQKAPICGRVCMDQLMVYVTDIPEAEKGDEVTLLGKSGDACITLEELGELSGRFNYEFACLITPRVPRVHYGHKETQKA